MFGLGVWRGTGSTKRATASPTPLLVTLIMRISIVYSSIPMWILRQMRRFVPPCLRAFYSLSHSALIPVLSTRRCRRPLEPWYGMEAGSIFYLLSAASFRCAYRAVGDIWYERPALLNPDRLAPEGFPQTRSSALRENRTVL